MKKEIIVTAKTVEEAMSEAYAKYSAEGEVSCEILGMPKKGFLGIGGAPAKVKVIIDDGEKDADISAIISDMKAMKVETDKGGDGSSHAPAKRPDVKQNKTNAENKPSQIKAEKTEKSSRSDKNERSEKKTEAKPQNAKSQANKVVASAEKKKAFVQPTPAVQVEKKAEITKNAIVDDNKKRKYDPVTDTEMQFAIEFVETVLRDLEIEAKAVSVKDDDGDYVGINIEGENTGALIGHHGETLDAIQYLANLSASRRSPTPNREFLKITVDIENYRAKREETLRALARRMAAKAVKYKRNFVLEPMNPYERRIIHSEIQQIENVDTHSVGSDENRKVVVTYEGSDKVDRRSRQRRRSGYNKNSANAENASVSAQSFDSAYEADETIDLN